MGANATATDGAVILLIAGGPIIGVFVNQRYKQQTIQIESGDVLIGYTDAGYRGTGMLLEWNLASIDFSQSHSLEMSSHETTDRIVREVLTWQGPAVQHDDITLVIAKVK